MKLSEGGKKNCQTRSSRFVFIFSLITNRSKEGCSMMNYSLRILLGLIFFIFLCSPPGLAQTGEELRREIESLKEGQKTI